jgi:peptidoglycan/LPS O-acetylase OafA/YrhL
MGAVLLWERRRRSAEGETFAARHWVAAGLLALTALVTAWWSYQLLGQTPNWLPWLRYAVLVAGIAAALGLLAAGRVPTRLAPAFGALGVASALAGPGAYAVATAEQAHSGSLPSAGPAGAGMGFGGGGGPGGGGMGGMDGGIATLLNGSDPGKQITALLKQNASSCTRVDRGRYHRL